MKKSLRKPDKIRFKAEFDQIRGNGNKLVGSRMLIVHAPAPDGRLRCGVICGKKYSLLSVRRNRARRLLWESFRLLKPQIGVGHYLLIPRKRMENAMRQDVTMEMASILARANLIPREAAQSPPEC